MLKLIKFSKFRIETHFIAFAIGLVTLSASVLTDEARSAVYHSMSAMVGIVSWYVFKLCDGITIDDQPTVIGAILGLLLAASLTALHFL